MRVLLIYFSVNMILSFVESLKEEDVQDLSDWCIRDRMIYFYLTSGIGPSDISVGMIAQDKSLNCTVLYSVKPKQNIMLVLEFLDLKPQENICISQQRTSLTVSDTKKGYCHVNGSQYTYSIMSEERVSVQFKFEKLISTIKIIATSMKNSRDSICSYKNDIKCWVDGKVFCMTHLAACDGHSNCGVPDSFDEDKKKCEKRRLTFLMILASIIMGILSLCLFSSLWMAFLPKRKETFVYKFDQRMPLFDSEGGIIDAEVEIQVLFPNEKQTKK